MYTLTTTHQFEKDWKLCAKRGYDMSKIKKVISLLVANGSLPVEYKAHKLSGKHRGEWECHIEPDWLLVWEQNDTTLTLLMLNTGTHSDIFK